MITASKLNLRSPRSDRKSKSPSEHILSDGHGAVLAAAHAAFKRASAVQLIEGRLTSAAAIHSPEGCTAFLVPARDWDRLLRAAREWTRPGCIVETVPLPFDAYEFSLAMLD